MTESAAAYIIHRAELPFQAAAGDGASGLSLARLYRPPDNSVTFQIARIEPGGVSRRHAHPWEQVNWVAAGEGLVEVGDRQLAIAAGDCIVFPAGVEHAISSTGAEPLLLVAVLGAGAR